MIKIKYVFLLVVYSVLFSCEQDQSKIKGSDKPYEEITFITSDSITIFGELYKTSKSKDIILLFHQGGSNIRGEYRTIIPKLLEQDINILAIDQRVGGQIYGSYNRTIANIPSNSFDNNYGYCDAYNNLEGALDYLIENGYTGGKMLWGSSYSASLAIKLASERQNDLLGVLAFSPAAGTVMEGCNPEPYFEKITIPLLILKPPNEMESDRSKTQFELAATYGHKTYAAKNGIHGSSMLVESRVGADVSENWTAVLNFISDIRTK